MLNRVNFVSNFGHEHDTTSCFLYLTRTQIQISVLSQLRFVSCIFVVSCHQLSPLRTPSPTIVLFFSSFLCDFFRRLRQESQGGLVGNWWLPLPTSRFSKPPLDCPCCCFDCVSLSWSNEDGYPPPPLIHYFYCLTKINPLFIIVVQISHSFVLMWPNSPLFIYFNQNNPLFELFNQFSPTYILQDLKSVLLI